MGDLLLLLSLHLPASLQLGFKSHVVIEEVSHLLLKVLHLVLQFTHLGLQLISCTNLTALRWNDSLLRLYMGADKVSLISINMFMHLMPVELNSHNTNASRQNQRAIMCIFSLTKRPTHVEGDTAVYSAYWQTYTYIFHNLGIYMLN